jgi:hypothetical protein
MGRHRTGWLSWLWRVRREQAQAKRESAVALERAQQAQREAEHQERASVNFMDQMNRFLERHG